MTRYGLGDVVVIIGGGRFLGVEGTIVSILPRGWAWVDLGVGLDPVRIQRRYLRPVYDWAEWRRRGGDSTGTPSGNRDYRVTQGTPRKRCQQCGRVRPVSLFVTASRATAQSHRPRCADCEASTLVEAKADTPIRHKARDTRRRHRDRLASSDYAATWPRPVTLESLTGFYGWTIDAVEAAFRVALEAGACPVCGVEWSGLSDVTLDVDDPTAPPLWGVNTQVICNTCNRRKGTRSLHEFRLAEAERQAIVREDGPPRLFDPDDYGPRDYL